MLTYYPERDSVAEVVTSRLTDTTWTPTDANRVSFGDDVDGRIGGEGGVGRRK